MEGLEGRITPDLARKGDLEVTKLVLKKEIEQVRLLHQKEIEILRKEIAQTKVRPIKWLRGVLVVQRGLMGLIIIHLR